MQTEELKRGRPGNEASDLLYSTIANRLTLRAEPSLIPRPFPPPVFDRLQYAKMEGEGLGEESHV